jgi:hypothetical protein
MQAYQRIQISLNLYDKPVGNVRLYKRVLKHCGYDEQKADDFILSDKGGFTHQELARVKTQIRYEKKRYPKRKKSM